MEDAGIYNDSGEADRAIARILAGEIDRRVAARGVAVLIFDGAPALAGSYRLLSEADLPWTRVIGFQLAEWCGVGEDDPRSGRRMLLDSLVCRVAMAEFHGLRGEAANLAAVSVNYGELLAARSSIVAPLSPLAIVTVGMDGQIGSPPLPMPVKSTVQMAEFSTGQRRLDEVVVGAESIGLTRQALHNYDRLILQRGPVTSRITLKRGGEDDENPGRGARPRDTSHP
ncbi:MAG: 6-phosphogluconolactonase [Acidobacteriota bacterium]